MSKIIRSVVILLLVLVTAGAVGIAKALVEEGAISWYLPIIVAGAFGAIIGMIVHSNSSSSPRIVSNESESGAESKLLELDEATENPLAAKYSADEEWEILFKYDSDVRKAVDTIKAHGTSAIDELRKAHWAIKDKTQLPRIAQEINTRFTQSAEKDSRERPETNDQFEIQLIGGDYYYKGKFFKKRSKAMAYAKKIQRQQ